MSDINLTNKDNICKCINCNTLFSYDRLDIFNFYTDDQYVKCPNCNASNKIDTSEQINIKTGSIIKDKYDMTYLVLKIMDGSIVCLNNNFRICYIKPKTITNSNYKLLDRMCDIDDVLYYLSDYNK